MLNDLIKVNHVLNKKGNNNARVGVQSWLTLQLSSPLSNFTDKKVPLCTLPQESNDLLRDLKLVQFHKLDLALLLRLISGTIVKSLSKNLSNWDLWWEFNSLREGSC